jgi:hypothetical protein
MAQLIERLKAIDRRILAVVGGIPILICLFLVIVLLCQPTTIPKFNKN